MFEEMGTIGIISYIIDPFKEFVSIFFFFHSPLMSGWFALVLSLRVNLKPFYRELAELIAALD